MQKRHLWRALLLLGMIIGVLIVLPGLHAFAHTTQNVVLLASPTPDATTTLQMAQQEEANIQTILNIINILVVVYPLLFAAAGIVLGLFGLRGFRSLQKQGEKLVDDIKKLQLEAEKKKTEIEHTQTALVYLALGDRLFNQKDMRKAIEAYKKVGELLRDDPQINYVLGRIYSGAGYYEEAIETFKAAIADQQDYAEAEMELGLAYRRRGEYQKGANAKVSRDADYERAIEHLQRAVTLRPSYEDALSTLGGLYRRKEEYDTALAYYERAYRSDPGSSYALSNVASLSWYLGKVTDSRKYYIVAEATATIRTMDLHLDIYWNYYDLALAQLVLGKTEEARKNYQKAIGDTPGIVQLDSVLNVLYLLQKAKDPITGLLEVIQMVEQGKTTKF